VTYVITEPCIRDGGCAVVCPVECIVAVDETDPKWGATYWIDPVACIDCGACALDCPTDAIYEEDEVPDHHKDWIAKNAAFFKIGPGYGDSARPEVM